MPPTFPTRRELSVLRCGRFPHRFLQNFQLNNAVLELLCMCARGEGCLQILEKLLY
jgi:hypothetical protein